MKKKLLISSFLGGITGIVLTTSILSSCSKTNKNPINNEYKSIWEIDNSKFLYLKNHNLGSDINDIKVFDSNNVEILFNKELCTMNEYELFIPINSIYNLDEKYVVKNIINQNSVIVSNKDQKIFKKYNLKEDQQYFFDLVKDMSQNNIPTIGYIRDASLIVQESFFISLVNYFNNINNPSTLDKSFFFGTKLLWDQKRLNFDVLIKHKIWDGKKDLSYLDDVNSYKNFNLYELVNNDFYNNTNAVINYFDKIMKNLSTLEFDLVLDEGEFINKFDKFDQKFFDFIIKHANKLLIMSDGAYHTNTTIPKLESMLKNHNPRTREETITLLDNFRTEKIKHLTKDDVLDIILLKNYELTKPDSKFDYVSFINYDSNIFNSLNLNDNQRFHDSAFSTNFVDYQNCITDYEQRQEYLDTYSKLFINDNLTTKEVFSNGFENYDPKKPNAIFIGSSLFKPFSGPVTPENYSRLTSMPFVLAEVKQTINKFFEKYDPNQYNIIFKLHPVFSNKDDPENIAAKNYVKLISGIDNPIIIDSSIPLEILISYDYYRYKYPDSTGSYQSILFKENLGKQPYEWTTFFGLQATTTTIHTTRLFYQTVFDLDIQTVANLIPFSNFPIPRLFPVVKRLESDNLANDYTEENVEIINNLYKLFVPSIEYKDLNITNILEYDSIILNFGENYEKK